MLFNSLAFLIFAAIFFALWPLCSRNKTLRFATITIASFIFYGFWDARFLLLLIGTGFADFFYGLQIEKAAKDERRKKLIVACSLATNLGALAAFKYSRFFASAIDLALTRSGIPSHVASHVPDFLRVLPPGISFYTFQSMSYTIDIYRGKMRPTRSPLHFFAFLSMFPVLVAGPIVRAKDLLPEIETHRSPSADARFSAIALIAFGYFKKVVIADNLAGAVEHVYGGPQGSASSFLYWLATLMFAIQIYCDFSGYTDIARGLGRLMGYEFPKNFAHPYMSLSFREYWQRWHITLSSWFRDYVYIPLGGNRVHVTRNLWVTMLLSGLWHGASFTFVLWGAWHALLLTIERATQWPKHMTGSRLTRLFSGGIVFLFTLIGWVFFRARDTTSAIFILKKMLQTVPTFDAAELPKTATLFLGVGIATEIIAWRASLRAPDDVARSWVRALGPLGVALLIACCIYFRGPGNAFIYFQF